MFILRGGAVDLRQGWTRRDVLRVGLGPALGLARNSLFLGTRAEAKEAEHFGQARSCILIYLFGGPSHIDIWDMKPAAPAEIRGEFKPQATNVPGIQITEHLPRLARMADKYAIIRSLAHGDSAHGSAGHTMLTGRAPRLKGEVPPDQSLIFAPQLSTLPENVTGDRWKQRRTLRDALESHDLLGRNSIAADMGELYQRAYRLIESPRASEVFRLSREPDTIRQRYGMNVFGQSLLLARRLVEAGVPMITVYWPDRKEPEAFLNNGVKDNVGVPAWDTHGNKVGKTPNFPSLKDKLLPALDLASSALLEDLQARGLLDQTLVVWTGEFGRSPRINSDAGRDHYGNVFSAMLAGGGIRGGQVYGTSEKNGAFPDYNAVSPAACGATLYHCLGVKPDATIPDRLGRPVYVCEGQPVNALL